MKNLIGFCMPDGGLVHAQVIQETPKGWQGIGGHLSTNQDYAYYDAERIALQHMTGGDVYRWVGLFDNQDEMDHFQQWHPPA